MGSDNKRSLARSVVLGLLGVVVVIVVFRTIPVGAWLTTFQGEVRELGALGYALYALVYAVCVILFVPASVLTLGAGALYGLVAGTGIVLLGATFGATGAFLLARTLLRSRVEEMTRGSARFGALDRAISREGAKIVLLVRLSPIFPFTYSNYAFGLTGVGAKGYVAATALGMIPGTIAYVYLGAAAAEAATGSAADLTRTLVWVLGAAATLAVTVFVARLAAKAIREAGVKD